MLETAHALRTVGLGRRKENTDEITDDREWRNQPVFTFEEESCSRQSQGEKDKHIQRRRVVRDKDRLNIRQGGRSMLLDPDAAQSQDGLSQPPTQHFGVEPPQLESCK